MGTIGGIADDVIAYISKVSKAISETATGAAAGIDMSSMSAEALSHLGRDAAISDMGSVARRLLKSGIDEGVIANDETMKNLLRKGKPNEIITKAAGIAAEKTSGGGEAYQKAITKFNEKKALFSSLKGFDMSEGNAAKYFEREGKGVGVLRTAQGFMSDPTRKKVAIGAYAGAAVGGRLISGGSLTTNNRGERDIAGIPFI